MSEERLKQVAAVIAAKRASMTLEEARDLAKRALRFKEEKGRLPSLTAADAWEKRMAEGVAFLQRKAKEAAQWLNVSPTKTWSCSANWASTPRRQQRAGAPPREQRIIAGFEEIERFVRRARPPAAARRRTATSSSGSTPCGSIACGNRRNAAKS